MLSKYTSVHLLLEAVCTQLILLITNFYTTVSGIYFPQRHCYMSTKCWIVNKNSAMLRPITKTFPKAAKCNVPQCWTLRKGLHYFTLQFFHFIAKVNKNCPPPPQGISSHLHRTITLLWILSPVSPPEIIYRCLPPVDQGHATERGAKRLSKGVW